MRDPVMESLREELARRDTYEERCPRCDMCGNKMTASEYYYDIYGTLVCDEYDCVQKFLREFRKTVMSYVEDR